ncbi:MAG: hypothetical protein LBI54_00280 [Lachnospiraceae bacterium]|jgi:hypothetical protein|nr:hypothetical protein [Lachnospiraceae bacterium]
MDDFTAYVPNVHFELIPINNLVSNQEYQRKLSQRHIDKTAYNFDLYQINPVKVSRRSGQNYVINGQHTIEIVAAVSESRETPVWCMVYDDLEYLHEADIFAKQQKYTKPLTSYEIFMANVEADSDSHIMIKSIVEQSGLRLGKAKSNGSICAVASLLEVYEKYGYDGLERTIRLIVRTWEGEPNSLTLNMIRGVALIVATFKDSLRDDLFAERVGAVSAREIARTAKERRAGSVGYAETMLLIYNKKTKSTLSMTRLHGSDKPRNDNIK